MKNTIDPVEIARETLKRLAAGNIPPTPANYQACYHEIAQIPLKLPFPVAQLKHLLSKLNDLSVISVPTVDALKSAIAHQSWPAVERVIIAALSGHTNPQEPVPGSDAALPSTIWLDMASVIESLLPALGDADAEGRQAAAALVHTLTEPGLHADEHLASLRDALPALRLVAAEQEQIRQSIMALMRLLLENIRLLTYEEGWLRGQVDGLLMTLQPPLHLRSLDDMERRLRDVIQRQEIVHRQSLQARDEMKHLLTAFVVSLGQINTHSCEFQKEIEDCADTVKRVSNVYELEPLLGKVIEASRKMSEEAAHARNELVLMQDKVLATEASLTQLYEALDHASMMARRDPLTETLNRKGLEEVLAREIARCRNGSTPLSLALLDLDDFKRLNDRLGHEAGDKALVHLTTVARQCMRPSDVVARYGGEEFVILMPNTLIENGVEVMVRLQRELTRILFLSGNEHVLITFSAGVTQVHPDEEGNAAIYRADRAMYLAKRTGKNRVVSG